MIQKRSSINLHWSHDIASIYLGPLHVDDCAGIVTLTRFTALY